MANNWSELVGEVIDGKYVIQRLEKEEHDRAVFLGEETVNGWNVLVEFVAPGSADFEQQQRRWSIASDVHHDHLVRIHGSGVVSINGDDLLYCAREQHDETLADVLASRPLKEHEALPVSKSVLSCLEYLHGRQLAHGDVRAQSVLAVGDRLKLSANSMTSAAGAAAEDMYAVGELISQMFRGTKIPSPLREVADHCLLLDADQRLTADQALRKLSPQPASRPVPPSVQTPVAGTQPSRASSSSASPSSSSSSKVRIGIAAVLALAAVLAAATLLRSPGSAEEEKAAATPRLVLEDTRPSPIKSADPAPVDRARTTPPKPVLVDERPKRESAPSIQDTSNAWAVIAATYRDYDAADRRAKSLARQFKECNCSVFPEKGKGAKYYVVLGSGLTRQAADRLRQRASSSGAPSDTYVTKLDVGATRTRSTY